MSKWNFEELLQRLEAIKGMGVPEDLEERIPGLAAILRQVDFRLEELEPIERILKAMTREERLNPELLEGEDGLGRRMRVAEDSDTSVDDVNALIWQFRTLCDMLETMSPEEVTQELIQEAQPSLEPWQNNPDEWKADAEEPSDHHEEPREGALDTRVDELLRKISREGVSALTAEEQGVLDEASRRYRERSQ